MSSTASITARPDRPERADALPVTSPGQHRAGGEPVVFADLFIIVPAALAGVGGVLLGDRAGLWLKTVLGTHEEN